MNLAPRESATTLRVDPTMKKHIIAFFAVISVAVAQQAQPSQEPTAEQLKAAIAALRQQRDQATQALQDLQIQLQTLAAELEAAKKQIAAAAPKTPEKK